jgi:hypothetical protein
VERKGGREMSKGRKGKERKETKLAYICPQPVSRAEQSRAGSPALGLMFFSGCPMALSSVFCEPNG